MVSVGCCCSGIVPILPVLNFFSFLDRIRVLVAPLASPRSGELGRRGVRAGPGCRTARVFEACAQDAGSDLLQKMWRKDGGQSPP